MAASSSKSDETPLSPFLLSEGTGEAEKHVI